MAMLKCKMCGGELQLIEGTNICECEYCGAKQTVPTADNEKKITLFDRANRLRMKAEFDKAATVYESIVTEFPEEAEGYWGLCLCKYGIEYVDDPQTGKKVPTCHRTSFDGIFKDPNFEMAQEYSDGIARNLYREEAKEIDRLQKAIIEVAQKEAPFDIFICYKETDENGNRTKDSVRAQEIYNELTKEGYKVFFSRITLEDKLGEAYEPYIFSALNSAKIMLAIGTKYDYYNAVWVKNEWSRFLQMMKNDPSKKLIPCFSDIDAYDMPEEFSNLQGQDMAKIGFLQDLLRGIGKILSPAGNTNEVNAKNENISGHVNSVGPLLKRVFMFLEDGSFDEADQYCERVLDQDPENAQAYLGKLMAELKTRNKEELKNSTKLLENINNYQKALRFGDNRLIAELEGYNQSIHEKLEIKRIENIYQSALTNMKKGSLSDYVDAKKQFISIREYKDAEDKCALCDKRIKELNEEIERDRIAKKEKKEAEEKKITAVIAAIDAYINHSSQNSNIEQMEKLQNNVIELKKLRDSMPELISQRVATEEKLNNLEIINSELQNKRKALGLFARKEKAAIDCLIQQNKDERKVLLGTIELITNSLNGFGSTSQVESQLQSDLKKIMDLQKEMQKSVNCPTISFDEALEFIRDKDNREKIRKRKSEYAKLIFYADDEIAFGNYYGKIEWKIIKRERNRLLLISRYGIEAMPYNNMAVNTTWATCSLRRWLNDTFLNTAFNEDEKKVIESTKVIADQYIGCAYPGSDTVDKVFLLSAYEAYDKYSNWDYNRTCKPTNHAIASGAYVEKGSDGRDNCWWWVRTPGKDSDAATIVRCNGFLNHHTPVNTITGCVRPALWINLDQYK